MPHQHAKNCCFVSLGKVLECDIKKEMTEACHRLRIKADSRGPAPMIAKFVERNIKEEIMKKR